MTPNNIMRTELKKIKLLDKGLSLKTVSKLTESQVNVLYSRLIKEAQITTTQTVDLTADDVKGGYKIPDTVMSGKKNVVITPNPKSPGGVRIEPTTEEVTEDETDNVTDQDAFGDEVLQRFTGQQAPHMANDMAPDGMDDDSDYDREMMGMTESEKKSKRNPWAICTSQLGKEFGTKERHLWNSKEKNKYERCVRDVKKSLKEGKDPISVFLEEKIIQIVEKHIPARITKKDLLLHLKENSPATAPTKPKTSPTVKPGSPSVRPSHPGKNPRPGVKPAPKAVSPEKAKDEVIDLIINLLEK